MELVKTILVLIIVYLLHKIYTHQDYYDINLIEGICSGPDNNEQIGINSQTECTSLGEGYVWSDDASNTTEPENNPQSNLPYELWKLPDKDGNLIELKNIRPWKELSNVQIQERQSDLPLSGALTVNDDFKSNYTGDEGPFKANESIATLLEQSILEAPTDNLSGQELQDYYASKCYEKVVDYNNRGQPNNEYGDPKPIAFRINSYTPNNNLMDPTITVEDTSKVSTCEILGTKEIDPRYTSNKNDWTKKYPIITPLGNLTQQDFDMNNKYPENIFSGCYAFIESEDGSKRQVLIPSNVDTPSENDYNLSPTKYYDHCLALNGSCGTGGGVYIDNKWVPGENCHGYAVPKGDNITPGIDSGIEVGHNKMASGADAARHKHNIKLSATIDGSIADQAKYSPEKRNLITPFGRDSYSDLQVKYKRNVIRNSIPGIKLQGPYYWKGPKIESSSSDSEWTTEGTNRMQSTNNDKSQPGNFGSRYSSAHREWKFRLKKSDSLGENFIRDTIPAFWDTTYSEDPREGHGGAKQIYTLKESNCDNKWFDGNQSDIALGRSGLDEGDNITVDEIPHLSMMDGPSKYIQSRFSGVNNFRKVRSDLVQSMHPSSRDALGPNFLWPSRGQENNNNRIFNSFLNAGVAGPILSTPLTSTMPRSELLSSELGPANPQRCRSGDPNREADWSIDTAADSIYLDNNNYIGTENPLTLPKCTQATKCRCRPSSHEGSDPSKCYVDTGHCGVDQGLQECNRDDLETTRTNKTYKKWTVKDKDGNDLVIQNLVPSITTSNQLSVDPDANNALVIHKIVLDEAPAHLRNYSRSKGYDIDLENEKESREKLQEHYASECANIAKTYPNATGFAVNNFEKNKLLNKRDGLGRCVAFNTQIDSTSYSNGGKELAPSSSFKPCNSDSDCGFFTNEDTSRINRDLKENPVNKYDLDNIHSTGLNFQDLSTGNANTYATAARKLFDKEGNQLYDHALLQAVPGSSAVADGIDDTVTNTAAYNRNRSRRPIETCMSFPTGLRNSNIGEPNAWHGPYTLKHHDATAQTQGPKTAEEEENSLKNPRWEVENHSSTRNRIGMDDSYEQGGNRNSYDTFNMIYNTSGSGPMLSRNYTVYRDINDDDDYGYLRNSDVKVPLNTRREGINPNYMPWSLNETQSMINDIKVSSYGLFGEWDSLNIPQYEGKSNVVLNSLEQDTPTGDSGGTQGRDWTKPSVRAAEKRIDDILHGTDPNGNPSQHSLVEVETHNPNPICIIYGKGMEGKYDKYPIPSSISALNNSGILGENDGGWQKLRTYHKNSIKGTQLPCISNNLEQSLIPSLNEDGSISQSDQLNNNNPGKGSISCKEMGIHAPSTKEALISAAQHWHDESGIPIYGENKSMYGSFGNDRLTNLYPISDYSKKGDDGVSHYTTYEKGNDDLIKWKDYKKTSNYSEDRKGNISPPTALYEYRGDIKNPIDARKPEFQIQAEWSPLQVYKLEVEKTPEELENERIKEEDKNACAEMWLDSPTSKMIGPTNKVHLRKNIKDPNLNNSPGVLEHGKSGNTCGGCYKPDISKLSTSVRMQVDSDRDGRSDQCYVNNTCDVSLQPGSLTPCNKEGIQPVVINGVEKPPLKWKRWALKKYYDSDGDGLDDSSEDVEMKSWANTERYKITKCIDSEGNDISTVNDEGVRVPETKKECEDLGHTWKLESMGGWEVLKDGTLYDWCPSTNAERANFGVRCRNSGNPRAGENTPRKFSPPMEGKKPPPLTKDGKEELQWLVDNKNEFGSGWGNNGYKARTVEDYLNDLDNVPLRKDKVKNVGMAKLNRNEDGTIKNVSVGLGYDHNHPESQRSKVLQRGNSWWGSIGYSPAGYQQVNSAGTTTYPGKPATLEGGGQYNWRWNSGYSNLPSSYTATPANYKDRADGIGLCVCHPGDEHCSCGRRQGGSFVYPSAYAHDVLRSRRLNPHALDEGSITHSSARENILYSQKLYNDGKLRKSAIEGSADNPQSVRQHNDVVVDREWQQHHGALKNICEPPQISGAGDWIQTEGGRTGKRFGLTHTFKQSKNTASSSLHKSSGSCLPRGVLPASSKDFMGNGSTLVTPYRPSELLRDILTDNYDSFRPDTTSNRQRWGQVSDDSTGEPLPEHTKESINLVRDFVNNFSNLDEPWGGEYSIGDGSAISGGGVKNRYLRGGNYRKLSQLDQVVLPLHPNRKNMTIEELQEDAAQKCTDHINTLFSRGIFPEKWRSKTGFLLDTPSSRIYKNPEGLFNQNAGNTLNLWHSLGDHTNANQYFGTGLRPNHSTESDGNVNKPWVCEPRVNLPKEITSSETEALYVSGIDMAEVQRNGGNAGISAAGTWAGIHSASFTNNDSMRRYHTNWNAGNNSHENTVDRSKVDFDPTHRDASYKCENSIPALEQCKADAIAANDPNCTSPECMSCVTDALTSKEHNKDCWMKAPDTSHVQWERLKCWEIFDPNFQDNTDDWTSYSSNIPESRRQICERLKNRTINPVPYLTRDMASQANISASDNPYHGDHESSNKWYLGSNKIFELRSASYSNTPGTLTSDDFEKLWNGEDVNDQTYQGELRITREGVAKDNDGNVVYHTGYGDEEVPLPKRIRSGSGTMASLAGGELNNWPGGYNWYPAGQENKLAGFYPQRDQSGGGGTTISSSFTTSLPASHPDPNVRTQGCFDNAKERYDGGQGMDTTSETCNSFINDANGKYVRLIGQDINGNPHYAKPDLSWHIYYKCDESWSDQVCKAGGKFIGVVPKNDSESANEYLQGTSHGPKPAFIPSKDLTEAEITKPIWMSQEEWDNLIDRKNKYNPNNNHNKPRKSKFSSVEYNLAAPEEIINETREEANKNIYKVPPSAQNRPNNEFEGPFIIPPNKGGISDGALRAFIGQHKAANGDGNHPEAWAYEDQNGTQNGNLNAQAEDLQPCCGWVIVPHDALYPSEVMSGGGRYAENSVTKSPSQLYNESWTNNAAGWSWGQRSETMRYQGVWQHLRYEGDRHAGGIGFGQLQNKAVHGLRAHTDPESSRHVIVTKNTSNESHSGKGISRNPNWSNRTPLSHPPVQEFVGIFAPSNKPEEGPPTTGWEINPYRSGERGKVRKPAPSVKITRGIDKDHTHRVCGVNEGYTYDTYQHPTGHRDHGGAEKTSQPLYAMQNIDGFSKNRIYRSWLDPNAMYNLSNLTNSVSGNHIHPHATGGFYSNMGGKEITSPFTKQYTSHIGAVPRSSSTSTELISHPCRGIYPINNSADYEHLSKDFFVLYDDSEEQLKQRCQELNISDNECNYDYINTMVENRRTELERLGLDEEATESEIQQKRQLQNECRNLNIIDNSDYISNNPSLCTQANVDQVRVDNARSEANTTISGIITNLQTAVNELTSERDRAARNWVNVDPTSASAAGIEPYTNTLVEGFVNYPIVEGLCVAPSGNTIEQIPDRCEIDSNIDLTVDPQPDCNFTPGNESSCGDGCIYTQPINIGDQNTCEEGGNSWIEDTLGGINQELYERANNLLGNANNLLTNFQETQSNINQYNSIEDINNASENVRQSWDNFTISRNQSVSFRETTRTAARNVICSNIMNQLPLTRCITTPQTSTCSVLLSKQACNSHAKCSWNTMSNSCTTRDVDHLCSTQQTETSCQNAHSGLEQGDCTWRYNDLINTLTENCDNLIDNIQKRGEEMKNECELDGLWKGSCSGIDGICVGEENNGTCSVPNINTRNECINDTNSGTWTYNVTTSDACQQSNGTWIDVEDIKSRTECVNSNGNWTEGNSGNELSDRCFQQPDESQTNVNIKDLSSFKEYIDNCNNPLGNFPGHEGRKCGNIDNNNFPTSFNEYENEFNRLKNDYISNTNKFNDIKVNEQLRLNLFKKVYGNQQYNQGYNNPDELSEHEVSDFLSETPEWLSDEQSRKITIKQDLEESNLVKQSQLNNYINSENGTNVIKSASNQEKENQLNVLNSTINNLNSQKSEYLQRPVTCRECIPCIRCNKCITLSAFKNVNECPQCPHCNTELDREIRTQTNICENKKTAVLNKKDKQLNESKALNINNDIIEEKNSKLSVLRKKKILALSSERNCQTDRAVINVSKNEMINNIRRYQLKNDELKERIEWERNNISWLDKLKGITKPFVASRDYTFKKINIDNNNNIDDLIDENP